jgi:hypothetical protein
MPLPNEQLLLAAPLSEAAGSLRSPAVLEELFLPAVEHRRLQAQFFTHDVSPSISTVTSQSFVRLPVEGEGEGKCEQHKWR